MEKGRIIKTNLKIMVQRKSFWFAFACMMAVALGVYFDYARQYAGGSADNAPAASSLYYLHYYGRYGDRIKYFALFLIILPYANSFVRDQKNKTGQLFLSKTRRSEWYISQAFMVVLGTCFILLAPSLLNILLNRITFPENGNFSAINHGWQYDINYFNWADGVILGRLYYFYPNLYNAAYAVLFAVTGAVLALFTYSVSLLVGRGRIYIYLIPYVMVSLLKILDMNLSFYTPWPFGSTDILYYLSASPGRSHCVYPLFFFICGILVLLSVLFIRERIRKDEF